MKIDITLEEAYARASKGLRRKMEYSINLLQRAEKLALAYDNRGGYFLAFSGGKDSQTLYHIAQLAGVRFEGHMNLTSVDAPEVIRFVRKHYPEVELIKPKDSIYHVAERKQLLPTKKVRWCCEEYKEHAGAGKVTLIGIRRQESSRRKKRNEVEIDSRKYSGTLDGLDEYRKAKGINITNATEETTIGCISGKESLLISPIINWTERDVWKFLNDVVRVPHCELYDQGFHRIGCIGCPMSNPRQKRIENERWPHVKRNWIKAIISIRHGGVFLKILTNGNPVVRYWNQLQTAIQRRQSTITGTSCTQTQHIGKGKRGFSSSSSSDGLTDEQEHEIAENIYDWWISGMSYKRWYAERFLQYELEFDGYL